MGPPTERDTVPMKLRRSRAPLAKKVSLAAVASLALAGCGEVKNTINPKPGTANQVTVALAGQPSPFDIGIYEAAARGYFKQADMNVHVIVPGPGQDPVTMVHNGQALIGISSEPNVLLHRNVDQPVVGVAALVHGPLSAITIPVPKAGQSGGAAPTTVTTGTTTTRTKRTRKPTTHTSTTTTASSTTTTPTTTTVSEPDTTLWPEQLQQLLSRPGYPTYDGLVMVARKGSIVQHAPLIRRFVQAVARGYRAARGNPTQAVTDLINAVPSLAPQQPLELATLKAAMPYLFPTGGKVWGWQREAQWNAFGTWLAQNHLLSNPNAIGDASTNELLQGQGV
jgi:putative hydroxymethylpyrimidine transport system substrate-binding protein